MELASALRAVNELATLEAVEAHWDESVASMPPDGPRFLDQTAVKANCEGGGLGPEVGAELAQVAHRIRQDPALAQLAWHGYRCLYDYEAANQFAAWPTLDNALGPQAGAFYLLLALAMTPRMRALHCDMGVDETVTRDCCKQLWSVSERYRSATGGRVGMDKRTLYWFRHYVDGELFRVGRMEYMLKPFGGGLEAYRHRTRGQVVALSDAGRRYDAEGFAETDEQAEAPGTWTATRQDDADAYVGNPISPEGMAERAPMRLAKAEWSLALSREDSILQMHIPGGGGMTPQRCEASLRGAVDFFRRHFPHRPFAGIESRSWIFNTQLQQILPLSANLIRFQRELYLFPIPSNGRAGFYFVFHDDNPDWATARRDTSLQRAIVDFMLRGNRWRCGGMFILNDDVCEFGSEHYRSGWPPEGVRQ